MSFQAKLELSLKSEQTLICSHKHKLSDLTSKDDWICENAVVGILLVGETTKTAIIEAKRRG